MPLAPLSKTCYSPSECFRGSGVRDHDVRCVDGSSGCPVDTATARQLSPLDREGTDRPTWRTEVPGPGIVRVVDGRRFPWYGGRSNPQLWQPDGVGSLGNKLGA